MPELNASNRATLPDSAFAYVDSHGQRRLPINDEAHVRNALARFNQVRFESEEARDQARKRLLNAARKYKIVPVGFITGQLHSEREIGRSQRDGLGLPTGILTLMMTDIEGSTQLVHELGDGYGKLIREVRRTIKKLVIAHEGHMVDARADESFAVFKSSSQAVACGIAIQRQLVQISIPGDKPVRTRIGLHTGRPKVVEGNYIGIAVHGAARVCSAAHGGQILLTSQTRAGIKEAMPERVTFKKLGVHKMRGLPEPMTLLQVEADGLDSKFPPLNLGAK